MISLVSNYLNFEYDRNELNKFLSKSWEFFNFEKLQKLKGLKILFCYFHL